MQKARLKCSCSSWKNRLKSRICAHGFVISQPETKARRWDGISGGESESKKGAEPLGQLVTLSWNQRLCFRWQGEAGLDEILWQGHHQVWDNERANHLPISGALKCIIWSHFIFKAILSVRSCYTNQEKRKWILRTQLHFTSASGFQFIVHHLPHHYLTEKVNLASCDIWYKKVKWAPCLNNSEQHRKTGFQMGKYLAADSFHEVPRPSPPYVPPYAPIFSSAPSIDWFMPFPPPGRFLSSSTPNS